MSKLNFFQLFKNVLIIYALITTYSLAQIHAYFGQNPPGLTPVRFPPDSLLANNDWFWHGSPIFSPDLMEMYWGKYTIYPTYQRIELAFVKVENNQWTQLQSPSFANLNYGENNPYYSNSGDTLYFISQRPGGFIFSVTRTSTGWSQPIPLNIPLPPNSYVGWQFSITRDKTIYLEIDANNGSTPTDIYRTSYINGQYTVAENIGMPINTNDIEFNPYIDPDERFIIFASNRPGGYGLNDLYISSRNQDGTWNNPINLGPEINSDLDDFAPYISPDGLYFFFNTIKTGDLGYNPYWVDAQIIYNIITKFEFEKNVKKPELFKLYQNFPNPFNLTTNITFELRKISCVDLEIFDITGKLVRTLIEKQNLTGKNYVDWNGRDNSGQVVSSGLYFYRLKTENFDTYNRMLLLK